MIQHSRNLQVHFVFYRITYTLFFVLHIVWIFRWVKNNLYIVLTQSARIDVQNTESRALEIRKENIYKYTTTLKCEGKVFKWFRVGRNPSDRSVHSKNTSCYYFILLFIPCNSVVSIKWNSILALWFFSHQLPTLFIKYRYLKLAIIINPTKA